MFKTLKKLWGSGERRKYVRAPVSSTVKFRILDSKNPAICSRVIQGKVLDISAEGLCIGTSIVQVDGLHVFHATSPNQNKLEVEVDLGEDLPQLRTLAQVKWYRRAEDEFGSIYKVGINWECLNDGDQEVLKRFLKMKDRSPV